LWNDDPRAHLGITIPNFPNFFMLYGPNTGLVVNGSALFFAEAAVHYVMACLHLLLTEDYASMQCRWQPFNAYNAGLTVGFARRSVTGIGYAMLPLRWSPRAWTCGHSPDRKFSHRRSEVISRRSRTGAPADGSRESEAKPAGSRPGNVVRVWP